MRTTIIADALYYIIRPYLLKELERQTIMHKRVVRLNVLYYTDLQAIPASPSYIPRLWVMLHYAIKRAIQHGDIAEYDQDWHWIHLPDKPLPQLTSAFNTKHLTYELWAGRASDEAAGHAEGVIRSIFRHFDYKLPPNKFEIHDYSTDESCLPDVFTFTPALTAAELKNISSDVISDPRPLIGKPHQDLYTKIDRHFRLCSVNGIHPLLIAPRIDPSFADYESQYKGLHCEMFYQLMPPHHAPLCVAIKNDLLFQHVLAVDTRPPFPPELQPLLEWAQSLPDLLRRYT